MSQSLLGKELVFLRGCTHRAGYIDCTNGVLELHNAFTTFSVVNHNFGYSASRVYMCSVSIFVRISKHIPLYARENAFWQMHAKTPDRLDQRRINNEIEFHLTDSAWIHDEAIPCMTTASLIILKSKQNRRSPITPLLSFYLLNKMTRCLIFTDYFVLKTIVLVKTPTEDEVIDW